MTRTTAELTIVTFRVVRETCDDDREPPPSLPPFPVVETSGESVPEPLRPLAKILPFRHLRAVGSK
jgi:hypothetical protein